MVMMWASEAVDETLPGDSSAPDGDDTRTMIPDRAGGEHVGGWHRPWTEAGAATAGAEGRYGVAICCRDQSVERVTVYSRLVGYGPRVEADEVTLRPWFSQ